MEEMIQIQQKQVEMEMAVFECRVQKHKKTIILD